MKTKRIIYWIATAIICLVMGFGGTMDILQPEEVVKEISNLGYPLYFATMLGVAKILSVIALLIPKFPRVKEWAYAGITFDLIAAFVSHLASGDAFTESLAPIIFLVITIVSYVYYHKGVRD